MQKIRVFFFCGSVTDWHSLFLGCTFSLTLGRSLHPNPSFCTSANATRHSLIWCGFALICVLCGACHLCCDWSFHIPVLCGSCKTEWMDSLRVSNELEFQTRVKNRGGRKHARALTQTHSHRYMTEHERTQLEVQTFFFQASLYCKDISTSKDLNLCFSVFISLDIKVFCEEVLRCLYGMFNSLCACCVINKSIFEAMATGPIVKKSHSLLYQVMLSQHLTYCKEIAICKEEYWADLLCLDSALRPPVWCQWIKINKNIN